MGIAENLNNWIHDDVTLDFSLPKSMLHLIEEAEKLAEAGDYAYFNYAEALDDGAKELYARGILTKAQWNRICLKYEGFQYS